MIAALRADARLLPSDDDTLGDSFANILTFYSKRNSPTQQQDAQAQAEIDRRRGLGESDQDIFLGAVQKGEIEIVGAFIRNPPAGFDINMVDSMGQNALHRAMSLLGHYAVNPGDMSEEEARSFGKERTMDMLKLLIEDGKIDKAKLDNAGTSAWSIAAQYSKVPEMQEVASYLKDQLTTDANAALEAGDTERLETLVAAGANSTDIWFSAVKDGKIEIVRSFLENPPKGFDVNATDESGRTALHHAIGLYRRSVSNAGDTSPEDARKLGKERTLEMVKLLIEEGKIDQAKLDGAGTSAWSVASGSGYDKIPEMQEVASYLKEQLNAEADTAVENKDKDRLDQLIAAGADERDIEGAEEDAQGMQAGPLGPDTQIPENDTRTTQEIIDGSKVFRQLSEPDRQALLDFIGKDVKDERHKVYLAVAVLNHIEHFNSNGEVIILAGDGRIDGWDRASRTDPDAKADGGSEASRFKDFLENGWETLKGDSKPNGYPPQFEDAPDLSVPEGKSAKEILEKSELFQNLSYNDKAALWNRVGNFEEDPAAAQRVIEVLNHVERYDADGKPIEGGASVGNGRIDGWDRANRNETGSRAEKGTEAERFLNFIKHGWSSLKTETDAGKVADIEKLESQADRVGDDYAKFEDFMNQLKESAYYGIISEAGLPSDKRDFIENPDNYSTEERAAAVVELMIMRERIGDGIDNYSEYGVVHGTNYYGRGEIQLHSDPQKVIDQLDQSIDKLMNDDVASFISDRESEELQEITATSSKLREFLGDKAEAMGDDAWGLDHTIEATDGLKGKIDRFRELSEELEKLDDADTERRAELEDEISKILNEMADPLLGSLGAYYAQASTVNIAAGENGEAFDDKFFIDTIDTKYHDVITAAYVEFIQDPAALNDMINGGMKPEDAIAQMNSRAAIFASFGSNPTELSEHINANIQNYYLENTTADELVGILLKEDGSFDEERLEKIIQKIREDDPESPLLNGDNGEGLSNAQIVAAIRSLWDTPRGVGKLDFSLSKFWADRRPLDSSHPLHKTFAAGGMHLMSGILASGAMIAKAAQEGDLSEADIVGAVGSGLQTIGLTGEAWSWTMRDNKGKNARLADRWNTARDSWRYWRGQVQLDPNSWVEADRPYTTKQIETKVANFKHFMRFAGATGGGMILGASIALGLEEMKKGNEAGAAVLFTSGAANAATLLPSYIQSIVPMFTNAQGGVGKWDKIKLDRFIGRIGIIGGALGTVANAAAFLAMIGYTLYQGIKEDKEVDGYFKSFTPTLAEYGIDGGGDEDPFWTEEDIDTTGS